MALLVLLIATVMYMIKKGIKWRQIGKRSRGAGEKEGEGEKEYRGREGEREEDV